MSADDKKELIDTKKKLEERVEAFEAAENRIKDNEYVFDETHGNIRTIEEQLDKYSYDKEMVFLLDEAYRGMRNEQRMFENLMSEIKESKLKSISKLEDVNEELKRK